MFNIIVKSESDKETVFAPHTCTAVRVSKKEKNRIRCDLGWHDEFEALDIYFHSFDAREEFLEHLLLARTAVLEDSYNLQWLDEDGNWYTDEAFDEIKKSDKYLMKRLSKSAKNEKTKEVKSEDDDFDDIDDYDFAIDE